MAYRNPTGEAMSYQEAMEYLAVDPKNRAVTRDDWTSCWGRLYLIQGWPDVKKSKKDEDWKDRKYTLIRDFNPNTPTWIWHNYVVKDGWIPDDKEKTMTTYRAYTGF